MVTIAVNVLRVVLAALVVVAIGIAVGFKPVYVYEELRCAPGFTVQPVSISVSVCKPQPPDAEIAWPSSAVVRHEIGLYLANLRVRVFHFDFGSYGQHWLAFDVPAPPY